MPTTTFRVGKHIHDHVRASTQQTGTTMQEVISKAVEKVSDAFSKTAFKKGGGALPHRQWRRWSIG